MSELPTKTDATRDGILIVNLGSPRSTEPASIAEFLREFLSDKRVVDMPAWLWQPILRGPILHKRPHKIREQYEAIWTDAGSPLRVITEAQAKEVAALTGLDVRYGYQYGSPNLVDVFVEMAHTCDRITILSPYPQLAPATTGSVDDRVTWAVKAAREQGLNPKVRYARQWATLPGYIEWYAEQIAREVATNLPDLVVFSWHSLPDRANHKPDGYREDCTATASAIMDLLSQRGIEIAWRETFQSKFGPGKWITPATIDTMAKIPGEGIGSVLVVNPGFLADCLETIYEMDVLNADAFHAAGGSNFRRIAPPDGPAGGAILAELYASLG